MNGFFSILLLELVDIVHHLDKPIEVLLLMQVQDYVVALLLIYLLLVTGLLEFEGKLADWGSLEDVVDLGA
jgi:hypothetical protein